jgi:hypothetical protein
VLSTLFSFLKINPEDKSGLLHRAKKIEGSWLAWQNVAGALLYK